MEEEAEETRGGKWDEVNREVQARGSDMVPVQEKVVKSLVDELKKRGMSE